MFWLGCETYQGDLGPKGSSFGGYMEEEGFKGVPTGLWAMPLPCQWTLQSSWCPELELTKVWLGSAGGEAGRPREVDHIFFYFSFPTLLRLRKPFRVGMSR